jgi:hypothetical protein
VKTTDEGGAAAAAVGKVLDALLVLATKPAKWELHIDSRVRFRQTSNKEGPPRTSAPRRALTPHAARCQ